MSNVIKFPEDEIKCVVCKSADRCATTLLIDGLNQLVCWKCLSDALGEIFSAVDYMNKGLDPEPPL